MRRLVLALAFAGALAASPAFAATVPTPSTRQVLTATGDDLDRYLTYIGGVYDGLLSATVYNSAAKQKEIFCQPKDAALSDNQVFAILKTYSDKYPDEADQPASVGLLFALTEAYPCQ